MISACESGSPPARPPAHGRFTTTRWSVVLSCVDADGGTQKMHTALAELCKIYWRPVFAFIRRVGHSPPDAQDLTQDFFVMVLKGQLLQRANPTRGRFRSLVLKALENFLRDAQAKRSARKRGGGVQFVSWDDWMSEAPSSFSISQQESDRWPAERIFDVRWSATVVERALGRLGEECEKRGRRRVFDMLSPFDQASGCRYAPVPAVSCQTAILPVISSSRASKKLYRAFRSTF